MTSEPRARVLNRVVVAVKQVPDTTQVKVDPETGTTQRIQRVDIPVALEELEGPDAPPFIPLPPIHEI